MCTVTYVSTTEGIVITSNRDEHRDRPAALQPDTYMISGKWLAFPKDPKAGGTWFATDEEANIAVLLNGAFENHAPEPAYRKSRGLVLLDIIAAQNPLLQWKIEDFSGIEPFTIILSSPEYLYQLSWDGNQKMQTALDPNQKYIWSSVTLYSKDARRNRELWFREFLKYNTGPSAADLRNFHSNTARDNKENGLVINRGGIMKTFSITQAVRENGQVSLVHEDLLADKTLVPTV